MQQAPGAAAQGAELDQIELATTAGEPGVVMTTDVGLHAGGIHQGLKCTSPFQHLTGAILAQTNPSQGEMTHHKPSTSFLCLGAGQLLLCPEQLILRNTG